MGADPLHRGEHLARVLELAADHERRQELGHDVPHRLGGLAAVVGVRFGDGLAPALVSLALHARQHEGAVVGAAEARLEEVHEGQAAQEQFQSIDSHRVSRRSWHLQYTRASVAFHYLAVEGPIGVGKTALAERLASRLDATTILEDADNPFLADFYNERPGAALQAQLFFLLNRHRQLTGLRQADLFLQATVCDYLFDKDKIFAYLNLDDNELFIYQRLYDLLARDIPVPDLVVYLQAPTDVLIERLRRRPVDAEAEVPPVDEDYIRELNEAYQHFFFHYTATPLLVVETSEFDPETDDAALDDLVRQIKGMGKGTRYYVARNAGLHF